MGARVVFTIALRVRALRTVGSSLSGAASARRLLMPARETEAIILKTFPLGEADRLVSFFGRSSGRVRGVAARAPPHVPKRDPESTRPDSRHLVSSYAVFCLKKKKQGQITATQPTALHRGRS